MDSNTSHPHTNNKTGTELAHFIGRSTSVQLQGENKHRTSHPTSTCTPTPSWQESSITLPARYNSRWSSIMTQTPQCRQNRGCKKEQLPPRRDGGIWSLPPFWQPGQAHSPTDQTQVLRNDYLLH